MNREEEQHAEPSSHNAHDQEHRQRNAARTRRACKAIGDLFDTAEGIA
jgi:hypothetical protein